MTGQPDDTPHCPPVSIFMFVRNARTSVRRAIDSVIAQTYPNIEFIVQDGVSTDGTLDILRQYGDRLKIVSEPDSGPNEGLWRALNRCSGVFIGSCLADEELVPDAVERAVRVFLEEPDVGAVTGDAIITDLQGNRTGSWKSGPFNFVDYLLCDYTPYFCSSFFRRQALLEAGLKTEKWVKDCVEFELWCRLATHSLIKYVPGVNAKYASHPGQSSNNARDVAVHFQGRLQMILALCSETGFLGDAPLLRAASIWGHARAFINHAIAFERPATADALYAIASRTMAPIAPLVPQETDVRKARMPRHWWRSLLRHRESKYAEGATRIVLPPPPDPAAKAGFYAHLADRYEHHGLLRQAVEAWRSAGETAGIVERGRREQGFNKV